MSDNFLRTMYSDCLFAPKSWLESGIKLFLIQCYVFKIIFYSVPEEKTYRFVMNTLHKTYGYVISKLPFIN